jgi:hypothetical protein
MCRVARANWVLTTMHYCYHLPLLPKLWVVEWIVIIGLVSGLITGRGYIAIQEKIGVLRGRKYFLIYINIYIYGWG